jgi:hypothetical protein
MSDPAIPLQAALYARLTAEVSCPTYDAVPMGTPYPYVTIDSEQMSNASPLSGRKRASRLMYLSVWSDYQGQAEVKRINAEIESALDGRQLILSDGRAFGVRVERMSTSRDADGQTYQGSVTVRVMTQQ